MNSAARQQPDRTPANDAVPRVTRRRALLALVMIAAPLLFGLWWHHASDDPLWPVFRGSLNLCNLHLAQLSPVSPDGLYRVHIVQATCAARFPETMVFVTAAQEAFPLNDVDPNRAVLEVAGDRTLDAAVWVPAEQSPSGREMLRLDLVRGSKNQVHRAESHWRGIQIAIGQSRPAPGADRLAY